MTILVEIFLLKLAIANISKLVMHDICIVLSFELSIRILDLESTIKSLVRSILLLFSILMLRIVIRY